MQPNQETEPTKTYIALLVLSPVVASIFALSPIYGPFLKASCLIFSVGLIGYVAVSDSETKNWLRLAALTGFLQLLLMIPVTGFWANKEAARYGQCKSNIQDLGTYVDIYEMEHHHPPQAISDLVDGVLMTELPVCPASNEVSYRLVESDGETTVECTTENHRYRFGNHFEPDHLRY